VKVTSNCNALLFKVTSPTLSSTGLPSYHVMNAGDWDAKGIDTRCHPLNMGDLTGMTLYLKWVNCLMGYRCTPEPHHHRWISYCEWRYWSSTNIRSYRWNVKLKNLLREPVPCKGDVLPHNHPSSLTADRWVDWKIYSKILKKVLLRLLTGHFFHSIWSGGSASTFFISFLDRFHRSAESWKTRWMHPTC